MPNDLLKLDEVAEKLRCSKAQVRYLTKRKDNPLRVVKISPRMTYVTAEELDRFMAACAGVA